LIWIRPFPPHLIPPPYGRVCIHFVNQTTCLQMYTLVHYSVYLCSRYYTCVQLRISVHYCTHSGGSRETSLNQHTR
jgi:hypothetical protein